MRRAVAIAVAISLIAFPAAMSAGLPQFTSCHGEVQVTHTGDTIAVAYDETRLYQRYTYHVRSLNKQFVCRVQVMELRHEPLGAKAAQNSGLRDIDSVKKYYRVEYRGKMKSADEDGVARDAFIDVLSGPEGVLIEIITFLPVYQAPKLQGDTPAKTANL